MAGEELRNEIEILFVMSAETILRLVKFLIVIKFAKHLTDLNKKNQFQLDSSIKATFILLFVSNLLFTTASFQLVVLDTIRLIKEMVNT